MPSKIEAAWRYMVRKPMLIDKAQLEYGNVLFSTEQKTLPDSISLPSVVQQANQARRNHGGHRTQLHSITSPQLSPGPNPGSQAKDSSRNLAADHIRKSQ